MSVAGNPDRGSAASLRLCLASVGQVALLFGAARRRLRDALGTGSADELRAVRALRAAAEELRRGLAVLIEELDRREQRLLRSPETWGQR